MSEYLDTTREQLVYEIDVDIDKVEPKDNTPDPDSFTAIAREILERMVEQRTQVLQNKIIDMDRKLNMLLVKK